MLHDLMIFSLYLVLLWSVTYWTSCGLALNLTIVWFSLNSHLCLIVLRRREVGTCGPLPYSNA